MKKSIVIIGKGPSVLKSTNSLIDSYDEVAICNFPPIEGYEQYIGTRAKYHFLNAHDPNPYKKHILNSLGLEYMFNTHYAPHNGFPNTFPDHPVKYSNDYGEKRVPEFKREHGFDPSTGIQAFDYFVRREEYNIIGVVGFDFFKVGERGYYYDLKETQESHLYLYSNTTNTPFNLDGIRTKENPHDSEKSEKFMKDMIKFYNKTLRVI